jgi:tetratricopeptide (TPR) repeat protein
MCLNFFPVNLRADTVTQKSELAVNVSNNPSDLDKTYKFVSVSIETGDYEAAIGALERILMFNPRLSRAEMELGFLYARLGAYQAASEHLNSALNIGDLDTSQQTQIRAQLADIDKRNQRNRVTGRILAGLRAQTNANFFPSNGLFQIGGVGYGSTLRRQGDVNSYEMIQIAHDYDFENQNGDQLETRGAFYATQQFTIPTLNV